MKALLVADQIQLTSLTEADLPMLSRWQHDADYLRHLDASPAHPKTADQLRDWMQEMQKAPNAFLFGIRRREDDGLIGWLALDEILWPHQVGWVSIGIGDRMQRGKGYGTAAMRAALDFAFQELNLHKVQLTVFGYNQPAIAMYEGLGFVREGAYREFLHRNGRRHDMLLYGLLRTEWEAKIS